MRDRLSFRIISTGLIPLFGALGSGLLPAAEPPAALTAGPFRLERSKTLRLDYHGRPLITGDHFAPFADCGKAEILRVDRRAGARVLNVIRRHAEDLTFRKEIALRPDGVVELTVKADYAPFTNLPRNYTLDLPLEPFLGASYRAIGGRAYKTREYKGTITADLPQGELLRKESRVRYIAFSGPKLKLVFDFNPYGVQQMYTDYPFSGEPVAVASVSRVGDRLRIVSFARSGTRPGALCAAKILIYESEFDYDRKHPYRKWGYSGGPKPLVHDSFGTAAPGSGFDRVDLRAFGPGVAAGWESPPPGLRLAHGKQTHCFANCVYAPAGTAATLVQRVARPGLYVITIHAGHPDRAVGPFDIYLDGVRVARGVTARPGEPKPVLFARYLRTSPVRFRFEGKSWAIHTLAMQLYIQQNEDYVFDRKLWVVPGLYEPDFGIRKPLPASAVRPPLPPLAHPPEAHRGPDGFETLLPPADSPALAWRRNMRMAAWAMSHAATGFEFDTPERVERQVLALKAEGFNTINEGSFFWNLAHTDRWDEGIAMIRMITYFAHKHGMKVIHHCDATIPLYQGAAPQYLKAHPDWLQRDVRYGLPTFSLICLNNPAAREELIGRMVRIAREAHVDGFMLDELIFASGDYCGCPYCRRKFTADTGAVLPVDPHSPVIGNPGNPLWVKWLKWRQRCVGDWRLAFRKAFSRYNPNICIMVYTTHYGLTNRWAPMEKGSSLIQAARSCDFVGTEIMSRNVYASCRAVFSYRRIMAGIGDSLGCSVWGLIYHLHNPDIAYAGWAMNQMNRQTTWMDSIPGAPMARYLEWPLRVDIAHAESVADAAIVFSPASRDFARRFPAVNGGLGMSQVMSDAHIQHDVLLDRDLLRPERLKRYKLLILPSVACTSAATEKALRDYVRGGGRILVTGSTSLQDENGVFRRTFGFAGLLGLDLDPAHALFKGDHHFRWRRGGEPVPAPIYAFRVTPRAKSGVEVLADILVGGKAVGPAFTRRSLGGGACYYLASPLGLLNREPETTPGRKWTFVPNRPAAALLLEVLRACLPPSERILRAVAVPERVFLSVHRQKSAGGRPQLLVHLLNLTGSGGLKPGDVVTGKTPADAFPALKQDLVFELRAGPIRNAKIVSPDYEGERPVRLEKRPGGGVRVTVPATALRTYAIVYLDL